MTTTGVLRRTMPTTPGTRTLTIRTTRSECGLFEVLNKANGNGHTDSEPILAARVFGEMGYAPTVPVR